MQLGEDRSDEVWQKCAGCLMVLAGNSEKNKERISYKEKAGPRGRGGRARAPPPGAGAPRGDRRPVLRSRTRRSHVTTKKTNDN